MTEKEAKEQIARLSTLWYWASLSEEGTRELVACLMAVAPTADIGRQIIDDIVREHVQVPTPWHIRQKAYEVRRLSESRPVGRPDCEACGGTGFVIIERGGLSSADICSCRKQPSASGRGSQGTTQASATPSSPVSASPRAISRAGDRQGILAGVGDD